MRAARAGDGLALLCLQHLWRGGEPRRAKLAFLPGVLEPCPLSD